MGLWWKKLENGVQTTNVGPFLVSVRKNLAFIDDDKDPWFGTVHFHTSQVPFQGGERFLTEEQARQAVGAWAKELRDQIDQDLSEDIS